MHDGSHSVMASSATPDISYVNETGLSPNTQYTRHVHAYNAIGDSAGSDDGQVLAIGEEGNTTDNSDYNLIENSVLFHGGHDVVGEVDGDGVVPAEELLGEDLEAARRALAEVGRLVLRERGLREEQRGE